MNLSQRIEQIRNKAEKKTKNKNNASTTDLIDHSVTKSNALVRAFYNFTLNEKRLMECLISKIDPRRSDNNGWDQSNQLKITAVEFQNIFNTDRSSTYNQMKKASQKLLKQVITIEEDKEAFPLMAMIKYHDKEGKISAQFNPWLSPHIQSLRYKFSSYPLKDAAEFTSVYTWRLFEVLMSWKKSKKETDGIIAGWIDIKIDDLRKQLGVPKSYNYNMFNSQILLPSKEEIEAKTGILIEIKRSKTGRKITDLRIEFIEKSAIKEGAA